MIGLVLTLAVLASPAELSSLVEQLRDADAQRREQATLALMELPPDALTEIRKTFLTSSQLTPEQRGRLKRVVAHLHASSSYVGFRSRPFLGVRFPTERFEDFQGAIVERTIPGCPAFPLLQDGDRIIGVADPAPQRILTQDQFIICVRSRKAGDFISLVVQRGGELLAVRIRLMAVPAELDDLGVNAAAVIDGEEERYWLEWSGEEADADYFVPPASLGRG